MTEWAPATDAEVAMRDALRTDDQESYFRILAGVDLLLPVSADALAGLAPLGWGTWSTGGRTHVLAFTSPAALQACLADYTGSARRVAYSELADTWPNLEWWLAVNPGLPIEGYLPAWFVAQLSRGDLRLPTRGPAREGAGGGARTPQDLQAAAMAANAVAAPGGSPGQGGPASANPAAGASPFPSPTGGSGFGGVPDSAAAAGAGQPGNVGRGQGGAAAAFGNRGGATQPPPVGPGGLPVRTPGGVLPSGLPSRVPTSTASQDPSSFPGFSTRGAGSAAPTSATPAAPSSGVPAAYRPPGVPESAPISGGQGFGTPGQGSGRPGQGFGAPGQGTSGQGTSVQGTEQDASGQPAASLHEPRGKLPTRTPMAQTPPLPSHIPPPEEPDDEAAAPEGVLPGRAMTPPSDRPASMAAAAQALAGHRTPPPTGAPGAGAPPTAVPSGIMPPVIPGAGGSSRSSASTPAASTPVPAAATRPTIPPLENTGGRSMSGANRIPGNTGRPDESEGDFVPANDVERDLFEAADVGSTDRFLSTLLLATVLVPVAHNSRPGSSPGESGFAFRTEEIDGEKYLVVFTSRDRLAEHFAEPTRTVGVRFYELIRNWPDPAWSFAVNPESPVGAKYPGPQVIALASWAADAGLGADPAEVEERAVTPVPAPQKVSDAAQHATVMQKTVPPDQVDYYLERGYDRVAGFVHRANEVDHLRTPGELFSALGLVHDGSPFKADADEAYVLRWPAYRPSLYRIPYGGQSEQALRAMDGWVIERPPFRGNGFAPGEGRDVIAEFKVDSVRLPHGAQLWRMDADGTEKMVAIFDCDAPIWRRVGEQ